MRCKYNINMSLGLPAISNYMTTVRGRLFDTFDTLRF